MTKGYVYILKNPSMPGLLKIGKTTRSVQQRANELWQTGVPTPFAVVAEVLSPDCHELERSVHQMLHDVRVSEMREFFSVSEEQARRFLSAAHVAQVSLLVEEFCPQQVMVEADACVDPADLGMLAYKCDISTAEAAHSIAYLQPEEMLVAVERWREVRRRRDIVMDYDGEVSVQ